MKQPRQACGFRTCKHDHRPAKLWPGYDNSGWPLRMPRTDIERCDAAAARLYRAIVDIPSDDPGAIKMRIADALLELFCE